MAWLVIVCLNWSFAFPVRWFCDVVIYLAKFESVKLGVEFTGHANLFPMSQNTQIGKIIEPVLFEKPPVCIKYPIYLRDKIQESQTLLYINTLYCNTMFIGLSQIIKMFTFCMP